MRDLTESVVCRIWERIDYCYWENSGYLPIQELRVILKEELETGANLVQAWSEEKSPF